MAQVPDNRNAESSHEQSDEPIAESKAESHDYSGDTRRKDLASTVNIEADRSSTNEHPAEYCDGTAGIGQSVTLVKVRGRYTEILNQELKIGGVTMTVRQWAALAGLRPHTVCLRIRNGMSPFEALVRSDREGNCLRACGNEEADAILRENQRTTRVRWHGRNQVSFKIAEETLADAGFSIGERVLLILSLRYPRKILLVNADNSRYRGHKLLSANSSSPHARLWVTLPMELIDILFVQPSRDDFYPNACATDMGDQGPKAIAVDCSDVWESLERRYLTPLGNDTAHTHEQRDGIKRDEEAAVPTEEDEELPSPPE